MAMKFKIDRRFLLLSTIVLLAAILRFYKLNINPPGLYWDEAVFGYDAYSVLATGHDHHGKFLPLFFESFGDWKLPVYHYLLVPSIALFGLNEFAVRFPSALLGTLTVIVFYFLVKKLIPPPRSTSHTSEVSYGLSNVKGQLLNVPTLATLMLAISPWHIQFSRGGFESTAGLFFTVAGIYLFVIAIQRQRALLFSLSFFLFVLSMYSYHAYRIFTPLVVLTILVIYNKKVRSSFTKLIPAVVLSVVLSIPLILFTISPQGRARAISQSVFKPNEVETARIDYDQKSKKPLRFLSKYLYQKPVYYSYQAVKSYVDHFSPVFLFSRGDQIGRHSQVDMGQLYLFEALFIVIAFFVLKIIPNDARKLTLAFLLLAPIPATIVVPTPHAYRTLAMSVPLAFLSGLGAYYLATRFFVESDSTQNDKWGMLIKIGLFAFVLYFFISYLHLLFVHYPAKFGRDWQEGYSKLVAKIQEFEGDFEKVYVTDIDQVPYIYLLFYQKYDPAKFIQLGGTNRAFDKYVFISPDGNKYDKGRILYAAPSWEKVDGIWLAAVDDSQGRHLFSLWEINGSIPPSF